MDIVFIGDCHGKMSWKAIDPSRWDKIVFLGDYIDNKMTDYPLEKQLWSLRQIINFKKRHIDKVVLLLGNHDMQYWVDEKNPLTVDYNRQGWRFTTEYHEYGEEKRELIKRLFRENLELFNGAWSYKNQLLATHAGLTEEWCQNSGRMADLVAQAEREQDLYMLTQYLDDMIRSGSHHLLSFGLRTWGMASFNGSPIWADITETGSEYGVSIKGVHQIVGHSRINGKRPRLYSNNVWCVDCLFESGGHFLSYTDGRNGKIEYRYFDIIEAYCDVSKYDRPSSDSYYLDAMSEVECEEDVEYVEHTKQQLLEEEKILNINHGFDDDTDSDN